MIAGEFGLVMIVPMIFRKDYSGQNIKKGGLPKLYPQVNYIYLASNLKKLQ